MGHQVDDCGDCRRCRYGCCGRVVWARLWSRPSTWWGGLDGPPDPADGRQADLREFDGHAGLRAGRCRCLRWRGGCSALASRRRRMSPTALGAARWVRRWQRGRRTLGRLVRAAHDDHPCYPGTGNRVDPTQGAWVHAGCWSAAGAGRGGFCGRACGRARPLGARDPRPAACGAVASPAGTRLPGCAQRCAGMRPTASPNAR